MKRLIVYGLGERYRIFKEWLWEELKNDYQIIAVSDKNKNREGSLLGKFVNVKEIVDLDFDVIIVTIDRYFEEIFKELQNEYKIPAEKIMPMQEIIESIYREKFLTHLFGGKQGVEIGGLSAVFESNIYMVCKRCDDVNYSADTVWWKNESAHYHYNDQVLGNVIIADEIMRIDACINMCLMQKHLQVCIVI